MLKGPAGFFCSNWKRLAGFLLKTKIRQPQQKKGGQNLRKRFRNSKNLMFQKTILCKDKQPRTAFCWFFPRAFPCFWEVWLEFLLWTSSNLRKSKLMTINSTSGPGVEALKQIRNHRFGPWNWKDFGDKILFVFKIYCICYLSFTDISKCITTLIWFFVRDLETTCNWIWLHHGKCVYMHTYIML